MPADFLSEHVVDRPRSRWRCHPRPDDRLFDRPYRAPRAGRARYVHGLGRPRLDLGQLRPQRLPVSVVAGGGPTRPEPAARGADADHSVERSDRHVRDGVDSRNELGATHRGAPHQGQRVASGHAARRRRPFTAAPKQLPPARRSTWRTRYSATTRSASTSRAAEPSPCHPNNTSR